METYKLSNGNTIIADAEFIAANYPGAVLLPDTTPAPIKSWPAFTFYRKLTAAQRIAIRTLASTDTIAADFIHTLDSAIASGTPIVADDPDLVAGLSYLTTAMSGNTAFPSGWATTIIS